MNRGRPSSPPIAVDAAALADALGLLRRALESLEPFLRAACRPEPAGEDAVAGVRLGEAAGHPGDPRAKPKPNYPPYVMKRGEAARYIGVSEPTLQRLLSAGRIPSALVGGNRLIRRRDLEAFVDGRHEWPVRHAGAEAIGGVSTGGRAPDD